MKHFLLLPKFLPDYLHHFSLKHFFTNQFSKAIKVIAFLLLMSSATIAKAQTRIAFTYDAAGNREKREKVIQLRSSIAYLDTTSVIKPVTELLGKMKITIYPNPTRGQLSVEITNMPTDASGEIKIYNIAGNAILYQKKLGTLNQFDFSIYPTGIYVLYIKVGQDESKWKIIKQ